MEMNEVENLTELDAIEEIRDDDFYKKDSSLSVGNLTCVVCGDRASGIHYKVISCDGCRGFFKRAVRKGVMEACRSSNDCLVNKQTRTTCKACRFKKCLESGMDKTAVQQSPSSSKKEVNRCIQLPQVSLKSYAEKIQKLCQSFIENNRELYKNCVRENDDKTDRSLELAVKEWGTKSGKFIISGDWAQIAKQSFNLVIKWVSSLNFIKNLNASEQCILLEDNWPLLFVITVCQFYECHDVLKMISMLFFAVGIY